MPKMLRWYLKLLAGLLLICAIGQLALPTELGLASAWGVAHGWQHEIGFWCLGMYLVIAQTLWAKDALGARRVAIALCVLQFLVATNHAVAAIQSHALLNGIMAPVNYACVIFGAFALSARSAAGFAMKPTI